MLDTIKSFSYFTPVLLCVFFLVKIPQVLKIFQNKSAQGINVISILLELFAITATAAYSFVSGFPFRLVYL
jgi:uncharacterized protein with PQ loop repeat